MADNYLGWASLIIAGLSLALGGGLVGTVARMFTGIGERLHRLDVLENAHEELKERVEADSVDIRRKLEATEAALMQHRLETKELLLEIDRRMTALFEVFRVEMRGDFKSLGDRIDRSFEQRLLPEGRR
jgi:hypothetical protein